MAQAQESAACWLLDSVDEFLSRMAISDVRCDADGGIRVCLGRVLEGAVVGKRFARARTTILPLPPLLMATAITSSSPASTFAT